MNTNTVADLLRQAAGTYVEGGFTALVISTEPAQGKRPPKAVLGDQAGGAEIKASLWGRPKLTVGRLYAFNGKGIKLSDYQGTNEVSIGDKATVDDCGGAVHAPDRAAARANAEPAPDGSTFTVNGQCVGNVTKLAVDLAGMAAGGVTRQLLADKLFWADVKSYASILIRIQRKLEAGQLTPSPWAPTPAPAASQPQGGRSDPPPRSAAKPQPGADGAAFPAGDGADESVEF